MARYAIWDKKSPVITPSGEVFTADQWKERYPVSKLDSVTVICAPGEINGAFFGTLGQMVEMYTQQGADFNSAKTPEEKLAVIEAFDAQKEEESRQAAAEAAAKEDMNATSLASIAASMEYQNLLTLDDVEVQ